ncbi:hypothetical protein EDD16DRAFT_1520183 [Pisolithus croceorrhizus]|nr:hypothetical protein EV401DRAFT_1893455 [Pisolithus croceorrhizus]KAI6117143.1 hypothetical protein EDD16DRAFT_1520183 [Pisolithus croceorrhizus]KAI6158467.1 hypothetical protein EDD17DRAFT_1512200 [Pisolithus thermaeus]
MTSINCSMGHLTLQASEQTQTTDPHGNWSAVNICLINFTSILHKTKMPIEWDIDHVSKDCMPPYIMKAHCPTTGKYDGMNYLHQLATFCTIICAGLLPSIFLPDMSNHPSNPTQFKSYVHDLDWVVCKRRKGTTHTSPFITMVIGFIISLYEQDSPIITAIHSCSNLKHWWSKHTAKAINTFLLLQDVAPLPMAAIQHKHAEVVRLLKTGGKYGRRPSLIEFIRLTLSGLHYNMTFNFMEFCLSGNSAQITSMVHLHILGKFSSHDKLCNQETLNYV